MFAATESDGIAGTSAFQRARRASRRRRWTPSPVRTGTKSRYARCERSRGSADG